LYAIFKRDEEILKLMANVPKSYLQEEIDEISDEKESAASVGPPDDEHDGEDDEAYEVEEKSELESKPKEQKLVNIHVKMEKDRKMHNRTDGTSLEAPRAELEDADSERRESEGEEEKEDDDEDEGFDLKMDESVEGDQMLPQGADAMEDSILSM
jgi:hypothetical protein